MGDAKMQVSEMQTGKCDPHCRMANYTEVLVIMSSINLLQ